MKARTLLLLVATLSLVAPLSAGAEQADVAGFYRGKTVQLLVGYSAGGGYDAYARTLARHLPEHIPGHPEVIVKNVPGAGSLVLMNQIANTLPSDGTVFGAVNSGMAYEPLFDNPQAQFDPNELGWLGNLNVEIALGLASKDTGVKTLRDLRDKKIVMGATGAGANSNVIPRVLAELFDLNITVISGYPGASEVRLAMDRGEVGGIGTLLLSSVKARNPEWLEPGSDYNVIYQVATKKSPELPDVPLASDMASTEKQHKVIDLLIARLAMGRPYVAPPDVPSERLDALRGAIDDTVSDPAFVADAEKQGLLLDYVSGKDMEAFYRRVYDFPKDVVAVVKRAMMK